MIEVAIASVEAVFDWKKYLKMSSLELTMSWISRRRMQKRRQMPYRK